jgi:hypothetical protein|tara:strand:+ start:385 stop:573 length:189 start_codon:yes stop_codon:yes gene_type:complete
MNSKTAKKLRSIVKNSFHQDLHASQYKRLKKIYITLSEKGKKDFLEQLTNINQNEREYRNEE